MKRGLAVRTYWGLQGGESIELYDGSQAKDQKAVYRIGVERVVKGEVKIIRPSGKPKIINADSRSKVVDILVSESLFLEFVGASGFAFGWYECAGLS